MTTTDVPATELSESIARAYTGELVNLVPIPGSIWVWEPLSNGAKCRIVVTQTRWNGEEWWIGSRNLVAPDDQPIDREDWNELGRWMEACVLVSVPE